MPLWRVRKPMFSKEPSHHCDGAECPRMSEPDIWTEAWEAAGQGSP